MLLWLAIARAATIDVCANGCSTSSLESAWALAADGDILEVDQPGVYAGGFDVGTRNRTIRATVPGVIIDPDLDGWAGGEAIFEGVVFDCDATNDANADAFDVDQGSSVVFRDGEIRDCTATRGGVGSVISGYAEISSTWVHGSSADVDGGFLNVEAAGSATVMDSVVCGTSAGGDGGAIYVAAGGTLDLRRSMLIGTSASRGGGVYNAGTAVIQRVTFAWGSADDQQGGGVRAGGTTSVVRSAFLYAQAGDGLSGTVTSDFQLNGWFGNTVADATSGLLGTSPITSDPGVTPGPACDPLAWVTSGWAASMNGAPGPLIQSAPGTVWEDADADGWVALMDCDDTSSARFAGNPEICDGIDNDCDGLVDEGAGAPWYADLDGDGWGDPLLFTLSCTAPDGYAASDGDCDDASIAVHPGAVDICDGLDNDCVGGVDDDPAQQTAAWMDADGDTYGTGIQSRFCTVPPGYATRDGDCSDSDPAINPGATELCNTVDDDCDGQLNEGYTTRNFWPDADLDGYGDEAAAPTYTCQQPPGSVTNGTDCDDADSNRNPGLSETCDGADNDCNGLADDGLAFFGVWSDGDGDGYGDAGSSPVQGCELSPGEADQGGDCDDAVASTHPGAPELCNGVDDDCDPNTSDGAQTLTWFPDLDGDGYGDPAGATLTDCTQPVGYVLDASDCDDQDPDRSPEAPELCNGVDDDCDGDVDDADVDVQTPLYYPDLDGDGHGDLLAAGIHACIPGTLRLSHDDCDDTLDYVYPGALEACLDGLDNDCDGLVDSADPDYIEENVYLWRDLDDDGFGDPDQGFLGCPSDPLAAGYVPALNGPDCDDTDAATNPLADDVCDGRDNDCDGGVDEGLALLDFHPDADGDGYGAPGVPIQACGPEALPEGFGPVSLTADDCDDLDSTVSPGADEVCGDGLDNDCNGVAEDAAEVWRDRDGDGYGDGDALSGCAATGTLASVDGDCDDDDPAVNPGATEVCNGIDDDCDPTNDIQPTSWYDDRDGDGYGDPDASSEACEPPPGTVADATDCDDTNAIVNPGATEVCDELDRDCDGQALDADCEDPVRLGLTCDHGPTLPSILHLWRRR
ncbi:MAG: hypothetical protein H6736_16025 [Alphaproteobacteria bacterium]|nr:hypothetical protein [Alphaproteobacteria bacterium]